MMTGAEALVQSLVREGVDVVFAYPGGASMPIHQALSHEASIRTILPRHEQGGREDRGRMLFARIRGGGHGGQSRKSGVAGSEI